MSNKTQTIKNRAFEVFKIVLLFACFLLLSFFVNKDVNIRSFYMDDLQNYYYFLRMDIFKYAFSFSEAGLHYRPISYSLLYLIFQIVTGNISYINIVNNVISAFLATFFYIFARHMKISNVLSIAVSIFYIFTHFSYFQIGQAIGIIESSAMFFAFLNLYFVISYLNNDNYERKNRNNLILIYITIFLLCFTHERYASLFLVDFIAIIMKRDDNIVKKEIILIALGIIFVLIRYLAVRTIIPIGTSKSNVVETFEITRFFEFIKDEIKYIFGINAGLAYLSGINFNDCSELIKKICYVSIVMYISIFIIYIITKITKRNTNKISFKIDALLLLSALMFVISSSVTIRVEMRWIYSSFMIFILYGSYMLDEIFKRNIKILSVIVASVFLVFFVSRNIVELYYRSFYNNIFFFSDLRITNSLADETIYKYGKEDFKNKRVYIFANYFNIAGKSVYYFYEPFYNEINYNDEEPVLHFIDDYDRLVELSKDDNNIVLCENYETFNYKVFKSNVVD